MNPEPTIEPTPLVPEPPPIDPAAPTWAKGAIAVIRECASTLGQVLRHPISGAPGKGSITVGTITIALAAVWILWRIVFKGGEELRDVAVATGTALSAWQGIRIRQGMSHSGGYYPPPSYDPGMNPSGVPGDQEWP